jgi:hypothetical protein
MENRPPSAPTPSYDAQQVPVPDFGTFASTPAPEPQGLDAAWPEVPPGGWPEDHGEHADPAQYGAHDHFAQAVHDQVNPDQPNSPKVYISPKRKAILNESMDKASQLGLPDRAAPPQPTTYISMNPTRPANTKRNPRIGRFIFLLLVMNTLITAAAGAWIYNRLVTDIETRLADLVSVNAGQSHSGGNSGTAAPSTPPPASDDLSVVESRLENRLADVQAQLLATQKRLSEAEQLNKQQTQTLKDLMENTANRGAIATAPNASGAQGAGSNAGTAPALSPSTQGELVLLKERNRLAGYADEAIATGARAPYDRLWEALDDPRLASLVHAARAEILRVQNYYLSGSRLDAYDIPVASYFPDSAALKDSQLKEDELVTLLANPKHPWQVRMKAANLIGLRRSKNAGDALVKAILEDQNLDVVKEASFSFEQMTGFRARLFEPASVKAWWDQYNSTSGGPAPTAAKK